MAVTEVTTPFAMSEEVQALAKSTAEEILRSGKTGPTPPAVRDFVAMLNALANGEAVSVFPVHAEFTVHEAAKFLQVPEPYLAELLDSEVIPFRRSGNDRLMTLGNLMEFAQETKQMQEGLDEIVQLSQEMGLYDD